MELITYLMTIILLSLISHNVKGIVPTSDSNRCTLFNYGDSNSDTGAAVAALGTPPGPPFGQRFQFGLPTARSSDGKIYIDFLCKSLELPYLSPYLQAQGSDFRHGANFAFSGAIAEYNFRRGPCPLTVQVNQFGFFQNLTRLLRKGSLITEEDFQNAIHAIDIGQNDLSWAFNGTKYSVIVSDIIPGALKSIEDAVKKLHDLGGRNYMLYNTGPLGCLPNMLPYGMDYGTELDEAGCRSIFNNASKAFNKGLGSLCDKLKSQLKDARIICTDMYSIKFDLFANPSKYGFEKPLESCIQPGGIVCSDPSRRVTLDGIHYMEAANEIIASKILSGGYSWPSIKFGDMCIH